MLLGYFLLSQSPHKDLVGHIWREREKTEREAASLFAELGKGMRACGLPNDLVAMANEASDDEIDHARRCREIIAECEFISLYLLDIDEDSTNFHQRMIRTKLIDQFYWQQLGEKNGVDYSCLALVLSDGETLYVSLDSCHHQEDDNHPKDYKKAGKVLYLSKKED